MEVINRTTANIDHDNIKLEYLLLIWVYFDPILYLLTNILNPSIVSLTAYIINIIIFIYAFVIKKGSMQKRAVLFALIYIALVFINAMVVSYKYYVLIEGFSSFIIFLPAIYIISSSGFDYRQLMKLWSKFTLPLTLILFVLIFFYSKGFYHYGEFAYIIIPNVLIICYSIFDGDKKIFFKIVLLFINLAIITLFGGRTSVLVVFLTMFISVYLFAIHKKTKIIFTVCTVLILFIMGSLLLVINVKNVVENVNDTLDSVSLNSRNFKLLEEQINKINMKNSDYSEDKIEDNSNDIEDNSNDIEDNSNDIDNNSNGIEDNSNDNVEKIFNTLYVTNRDQLYKISIDYIKSRYGLPGGMGVIRAKTSGGFYYTHNFFLEIFIYFGVVGAILFMVLIVLNMIKLYCNRKIYVFKMCLYLGFIYFMISLMGGNMFQSRISIMFLSLLFLYNNDKDIVSIKG